MLVGKLKDFATDGSTCCMVLCLNVTTNGCEVANYTESSLIAELQSGVRGLCLCYVT